MSAEDQLIDRITAIVAAEYRTFGGGRTAGAEWNPLVMWLRDRPPEFAAGVSVRDVVATVIESIPGRQRRRKR